jgi:CheY-like chemotaxis protein
MADGIDAIERNARVQAQLIEDLLDVSRITSGKLRLKLETIDPAVTINAALEGCMAAAQAKSIEVVRELDAAAGPILCDASRLQQVVWNLVNNAVKFTPRNGRICVGLRRSESSVQITVSDNGQGIRPDFLPHLFERFRQEDASTTRGHGGLGLGLAIVKHLVEMHGGSVTAESEGEGKGSTFFVRLPIAAVNAEASSAEPDGEELGALVHAKPIDSKAARDLTGYRILIVDDDPDARAVIRRVLVPTHAQVADAANVPAALKAVEAFRPHVLVSDIGMPNQDGFDLIRQLREKGLTAAVLPAIALTAFARDEDRRTALAAGYQLHLTKPVNADALLAAISRMARSMDTAVK